MSTEQLKQIATEFENIAESYSKTDDDIRILLESLKEILQKAKSGGITKPVKFVPGVYSFLDGELSRYPDLELLYSKLKLALNAGDDSTYNDVIEWAKSRKEALFRKQ